VNNQERTANDMKTITLAEWLKGIGVAIYGADDGLFTARLFNRSGFGTGPTPEGALQALCGATCGPDTLLDIGRSEKWQQAHGPDGVAGLCEGEAGFVICRDGALRLQKRMSVPAGAKPFCVMGYDEVLVEPAPNTFPTGLPVVYPDRLDPQNVFQDTLDRIQAWADEHTGVESVTQYSTALGFFMRLRFGEGERVEVGTYYDITTLTPGDFSRRVDEMLAEWEKLLDTRKDGE
jgi:hypothetical protein